MNICEILFDISKIKISYWSLLMPICLFIICVLIMIYNYEKVKNDNSRFSSLNRNDPSQLFATALIGILFSVIFFISLINSIMDSKKCLNEVKNIKELPQIAQGKIRNYTKIKQRVGYEISFYINSEYFNSDKFSTSSDECIKIFKNILDTNLIYKISYFQNDDFIKTILKIETSTPSKINYTDSLCTNFLKCPTNVLNYYLIKYNANYQDDSIIYSTFKNDTFEESSTLGDLNNDSKIEKVFLLPSISNDDGMSFNFYDTIYPRLNTNSTCAHSNNIFLLDDLNEDGLNEIGLYYSACSSRYKSLQVFSLIKNEWKHLASSTFDIFTKEPNPKEFNKYIRKISKNKFQMLNFDDGETYWKNYSIKH